MQGWAVPPPKKPEKTKEEFEEERALKVKSLIASGFLRSPAIQAALAKVPREDFILDKYRDYAYLEVPLPIPGKDATISCPHSYPLFYEPLELKEGDKFLEIGAGSGYGAAVAREVVGDRGRVITIEIDEETYKFAKKNLEKTGYNDITLLLADGCLGYKQEAPFDKICITASCPKIPEPLIEQLKPEYGRLIAPVGPPRGSQDLVLLAKRPNGSIKARSMETVLYVALRGEYGWPEYLA